MEEKKLKTVSEMPGCSGCPMQKLFPQSVFVPPQMGTGKRLVIAEAPGETETLTGIPLTGGSGKWFDICIEKAGIRRESLTIANILQCRPPDNIFPTDPEAAKYISKADAQAAVKHCRNSHLQPLLESRAWERIDVLGEKPLRHVLGKTDGIFKWRGSPLPVPSLSDKPLAVPTLHPAYLMRDQVMLPVAINDFRKGLVAPPEKYNLHPSLDEVKAFTAKELTLDIETTRWWTGNPEITMVGISNKLYTAMIVPFQGPYKAELRRIILEAETLVGHNIIQYDIPILFKALDIEWTN